MTRRGEWAAGDSLPGVERGPIERTQIARFAAAVDDFNPIHCDEEFAKKVGFPSVIAHGPLTVAFLTQALGEAFGPENIRAVSAQFRAPVLPGDVIRVAGTVTEVSEKNGERRAHCELRVTGGGDQVVAVGEGQAVIADA
jgi:acyl dehydratase